MRSLLRLSLAMVPLMASVAAGPGHAATFTGADLLAQPEASFPSIQPKLEGSSLLFEWGTTHGPPLMHLVRFRVNSAGALPTSGDVTVSAVWDMTRLGCIGFCAAGDSGSTSADWDPRFYLSDGTTMLGFGLGDGNNGTVTAMSDLDGGANGTDATLHWQESDTNYPAIGDALAIALDFTLHDTGLTARIRYLGIDRSWTFSETLARTTSLALLLGMDNDSGERYQVNSLAFSVPTPGTLALIALGFAGLAAARRGPLVPARIGAYRQRRRCES